MSDVTVRRVEAAAPAAVAGLCELLRDAVNGGASVGFLQPLSQAEARAYWTGVFESLGPGLQLWVAEAAGQIVGAVQLAPCLRANGRHRAEVQKLFVHSGHRGRGISSRLMAAAEAGAWAAGCRLLVLDTQAGSTAESVYRHLGWSFVGTIPAYALDPAGEPRATAYFFKAIVP